MPLSEHEQRMLDEMERQLFADDPRLARSFRPEPPRTDRRRIGFGILAVVLGLILLVTAAAIPAIWLGVLAFVGMVCGAIYAVTPPAKESNGQSPQSEKVAAHAAQRSKERSSRRSAQNSSSFMQKMEDRWERRSGNDPRS